MPRSKTPPKSEKLPFNLVVSTHLANALKERNSNFSGGEREVVLLLDILERSYMSSIDAHEIARVLSNLPVLLRNEGKGTLADIVKKTVADLKGRQDKSKKQI